MAAENGSPKKHGPHLDGVRRGARLLLLAEGVITALEGRRFIAWQQRVAPSWLRPVLALPLRLADSPLRLAGVLAVIAGARLWQGERPGREMREVAVSTWIAAPPEAVFAAIDDPRKPFLTENQITTMTVVGDRTSGVGTVYRWRFTLPLGLTFQFDEMVTEWVENQRIAYRAISGWEMEAATVLRPERGGTRVDFTLRDRLSGVWQWLIPHWLEVLGCRLAHASLRKRVEARHERLTADAADSVPVIACDVDIAASPAEVFRVAGDPRSKLVWVPAIKRVEMAAGHTPGPGARYRMDYWFPGGRPGQFVGRLLAAVVRPSMSRSSAVRFREAVEGKVWQPSLASSSAEVCDVLAPTRGQV